MVEVLDGILCGAVVYQNKIADLEWEIIVYLFWESLSKLNSIKLSITAKKENEWGVWAWEKLPAAPESSISTGLGGRKGGVWWHQKEVGLGRELFS